MDPIINIQSLYKQYKIGAVVDPYVTIRDSISNLFGGKEKEKKTFWALEDINLQIEEGETIGIVGKNGAGKSTLLKILSRITPPTRGYAHLNGRVASLLEVGTGFHMELNGRENVYLNGSILGLTRSEISQKYDEIVAFSGVERFLETPLKHYSSGMKLRLAFSVAAHLNPEILIIDEVLAVGDAEFQAKCLGKMKDVAGQGRTVLFVSHNLEAVNNLCRRAVQLQSGKIVFEGSSEEVVSHYLENMNESSEVMFREFDKQQGSFVQSIRFLSNHKIPHFKCAESIDVEVTVYMDQDRPEADLNIGLFNVYEKLSTFRAKEVDHSLKTFKKGLNKFQFQIPSLLLNKGNYHFNLFLHDAFHEVLDVKKESIAFKVIDVHPRFDSKPIKAHGVFNIDL